MLSRLRPGSHREFTQETHNIPSHLGEPSILHPSSAPSASQFLVSVVPQLSASLHAVPVRILLKVGAYALFYKTCIRAKQ